MFAASRSVSPRFECLDRSFFFVAHRLGLKKKSRPTMLPLSEASLFNTRTVADGEF